MKYKISTEADLKAYPENIHLRFYNENLEKGYWVQASGLQTFYAFVTHPDAKACVVISQGRAESAIKYAELIYDLYQNQYSVFIVDHQGQGLSSRIHTNPHLGFVNSFDDYVNDLHACISHVLNPMLEKFDQQESAKYLLCHSMGGAIACLYAQRYPAMFKKIAMSAPMLGIKAPIPESFIQGVLGLMRRFKELFKSEESYFFGQGDYDPYPFDKNRLTNSEVRYRVFRQTLADYPENQLGGISTRWLQEAFKAMQTIRANVHKIVAPCLVLIAEQEQIVDNKRLLAFATRLPNAVITEVKNAQHEILFEQDEARTFAITQILDFFETK